MEASNNAWLLLSTAVPAWPLCLCSCLRPGDTSLPGRLLACSMWSMLQDRPSTQLWHLSNLLSALIWCLCSGNFVATNPEQCIASKSFVERVCWVRKCLSLFYLRFFFCQFTSNKQGSLSPPKWVFCGINNSLFLCPASCRVPPAGCTAGTLPARFLPCYWQKQISCCTWWGLCGGFITRKKWKIETVKNSARQKSDSSALSAARGER